MVSTRLLIDVTGAQTAPIRCSKLRTVAETGTARQVPYAPEPATAPEMRVALAEAVKAPSTYATTGTDSALLTEEPNRGSTEVVVADRVKLTSPGPEPAPIVSLRGSAWAAAADATKTIMRTTALRMTSSRLSAPQGRRRRYG